MVQVKKHLAPNWQQALAFAEEKLQEGYSNIRIITSKSTLAKRYGIKGEQTQVRYWGKPKQPKQHAIN